MPVVISKFFRTFLSIACCLSLIYVENPAEASRSEPARIGVWVSVFSPENVLFSKKNADKLIDNCAACGITDIYLQVYRSDTAYYNSALTDHAPYDKMLSEAGEDMVKYIIKKAETAGIKVHAWLNLLSIAQNENANIIKKFGKGVLTTDQYGNFSMDKNKSRELNKHFVLENQLFLEPGDIRVKNYLTGITAELLEKYPGLAGLHLDYIRYPAAVPFIPGSKFASHGLCYGYTPDNIRNFGAFTGLDPRSMKQSPENFWLWDEWKRDQVTSLIRSISDRSRALSPGIIISCTVMPYIDRTYLVTFQDWIEWLKEGIADYIVAMNYTDDTKLMKMNTYSLFIPPFRKKVFIGLGAYLLKNKPRVFKSQLEFLKKVSPGGIVIFSYDELADNPEYLDYVRELK
ncbi:MAG: family 10 glycosylhydrolase [Candidatus Omnitrophota bacterium]